METGGEIIRLLRAFKREGACQKALGEAQNNTVRIDVLFCAF